MSVVACLIDASRVVAVWRRDGNRMKRRGKSSRLEKRERERKREREKGDKERKGEGEKEKREKREKRACKQGTDNVTQISPR